MGRPKLVSVVMPCLNASEWLEDAVGSILAQSHQELELIIVDDGSADRSREIAATASARDARVRTLFLPPAPELTSSARAANAGVALARGSYIARMDADDIALAHRIESQLQFLESRSLDACGGRAVAFGAESGLFRYSDTPEGVERELIFRVALLHPTLLARAELMHAHPYLTTVTHEDYEWFVRIVAAGARVGNLQDIVLRRRIHAAQANVRHSTRFFRDLRQYRFHHVMRVFPQTRPSEYQALALFAERSETGRDELEAAARWLVRLADLPDPGLRFMLEKRWTEACERSEIPLGDPMRDTVERQIRGQSI